MQNMKQPESVREEPVSIQLLGKAMLVTDLAQEVAQRVGVKLQPITFDPEPSREEVVSSPDTWPDLFHELRGHLYRIEKALREIDNTIDRTGL